MDLSGRVAVATGAGQGFGAGIAETLGAAGAAVAATDINGSRAEATAEALRAPGTRAIGVQHDVTSESSCAETASAVLDRLGRIDIVANNAAISGRVAMAQMPASKWQAMLDVNLTGAFLTTRALLPALLERKEGRIINVSSVVGRSGKPLMTHYCASKFGVVGTTQALARELVAGNITVNAVFPGIVRTAMWDAELVEIAKARQCTIDEAWEFALSATPLGRPQEPKDIGTRSRSWPRISRRTSPGWRVRHALRRPRLTPSAASSPRPLPTHRGGFHGGTDPQCGGRIQVSHYCSKEGFRSSG